MKQLTEQEQQSLRQVKTSYQTYIRLKKAQGSDHFAPKPFLLNRNLPMALSSNLISALDSEHPERYSIPKVLLQQYSFNFVKDAIETIWANFLDYFMEEEEYFAGSTNIQENVLCILALDELEADQILNVLVELDAKDDDTEDRITNYCWGIIQGIYPHRFYDTYFDWKDSAMGVLRAKILHSIPCDDDFDNAILIIQGNKQIEELLSKHIDPRFTTFDEAEYPDELIASLTNQVQEILKTELEAIKAL
jgi:hypothetical protein